MSMLMKNKILLIFSGCLFFINSHANADYMSQKAKYDKTQADFSLCAASTLQKNDDSQNEIQHCYKSIKDALTRQIKEIRSDKKDKASESMWRSINHTHQVGIQSCSEISRSVTYSNFTGYLDLQCEASFYISLAEAAIEVHYK